MLRLNDENSFGTPCFTDRALLDDFASVTASPLGRAPMGAAYFSRSEPNLGLTRPTRSRDLFLITIMMQPVDPSEMWRDGRAVTRGYAPAGGMVILDHRSSWATLLEHPFEWFDLYIPVSAINQLVSELGHQRIETLRCPIEQTHIDPVVFHLGMSLLPLVKGEHPSTLLFVEHVFEALTLHLAKTYGGLRLADAPIRGGLPAFQERRVKDMMMADLQSEPSLSELASSCGLSNRHFIRAFKASAGHPPHRWLLHRKIDRARELLCASDIPISEIAISCGFADQSHLTRMFKRVVGLSPALWRREKKADGKQHSHPTVAERFDNTSVG